jgi:hypothetical protein
MRHRDAFEKLEPPPGGLARLRGRLEDRPRARWPRVMVVFATGLAVIAIVVRTSGGKIDVLAFAEREGGGSEVRLGLSAPPEAAVMLTGESRFNAAIARIPTSDARVVMVQVATLR